MEVEKSFLVLESDGVFVSVQTAETAARALEQAYADCHEVPDWASAEEVSWWVSDKLDLTEGEFGFLDGFQVIVAQDLASLAAAVACMEAGMANPPYSVWDHEHRRVGWVGVGSWGFV